MVLSVPTEKIDPETVRSALTTTLPQACNITLKIGYNAANNIIFFICVQLQICL
jgi:hypothetical protein